jgi:heme exporter protein A
MSATLLFSIKNAQKFYGRNLALHVESFEITRNDRIIVSGDNGSGKSTLLRIIAGILTIDSGTQAHFPGWSGLSIGYLPQDGGAYRDLTVTQNQRAFQYLLGSRSDRNRGKAVAELLGISDLLNKRIGELSGGFKRLATIHGLLTSGASALVLDEPFESLDSIKVDAVAGTLRAYAKDYEFVVVSGHSDSYPQIKNDPLWSKGFRIASPNADVPSQI